MDHTVLRAITPMPASTLLTYLQPLAQVLEEKKLRAKENLNPCHQMPFLGSKYAQIAFAVGDSWIKGAYFQRDGRVAPPFSNSWIHPWYLKARFL